MLSKLKKLQLHATYFIKYFFKEKKSTNNEGGMGVAVSTLYNEDYERECKIKDEDKTAFDWCKEGNIQEMAKILENNKGGAELKDDQVNY